MPLAQIIEILLHFYGAPVPPPLTDPLELILWENIAYLVDDRQRAAAFASLQQAVGTTPQAILAAPNSLLLEIARVGGMLPEQRVSKLRTIAELVLSDFKGNLAGFLKDCSLTEAKKALRKFPGIGEPGAEKVLLFSGSQAVLGIDSNGLRVLLRLGIGEEKKSYQTTYRGVQEVLEGELKPDFSWLTQTHQLLRQHGQELCKRNSPLCLPCPLQASCEYYKQPWQSKF